MYSGFANPQADAWIHHRVPPRLLAVFHKEIQRLVAQQQTTSSLTSHHLPAQKQHQKASTRNLSFHWTTRNITLVDGRTDQTMDCSYHSHPRLFNDLWHATTTADTTNAGASTTTHTILLVIHTPPANLAKREMIRAQVDEFNQQPREAVIINKMPMMFHIRLIFVFPTTTPPLEFDTQHSFDMVTLEPQKRRRKTQGSKAKKVDQRPLPLIGLLQSLLVVKHPEDSNDKAPPAEHQKYDHPISSKPFFAILRMSIKTASRMHVQDWNRLIRRAHTKDYAGKVCRANDQIERGSRADALAPWLLPNRTIYPRYASSRLPATMNDDTP